MSRSHRPLRVLFSCAGRRVELIEAFRRAATGLGVPLETWGSDRESSAPALHFVDHSRLVPPVADPAYIDHMVRLTRDASIDLIIPLIDSDLLPLARAKPRFAEAGGTVVVSEARTVEICRDKLKAFHHLTAARIDTPRTWTYEEARRMANPPLPVFVKPRAGSAGAGLHLIETRYDLEQIPRWVDDPIVQEYVRGEEFTLDAYTGFDGRPACVVPRRRIRVRGGEVSQAQVVLDPEVIAIGRKVVGALQGCRGVVTIQCIRAFNGRISVIEINPRFGGGVPLSIAAGADMPRWLLAEHLGRKPTIPETATRDSLVMSRYDQSVFYNGKAERRAVAEEAVEGEEEWPKQRPAPARPLAPAASRPAASRPASKSAAKSASRRPARPGANGRPKPAPKVTRRAGGRATSGSKPRRRSRSSRR